MTLHKEPEPMPDTDGYTPMDVDMVRREMARVFAAYRQFQAIEKAIEKLRPNRRV